MYVNCYLKSVKTATNRIVLTGEDTVIHVVPEITCFMRTDL